MEKIIVLSLIGFSDEELNTLRAVSPRLEVYQMTGATFDDIPGELRHGVEILYGFGNLLDEMRLFSNLKWIQAHSAGINQVLDKPIRNSQVMLTTLSGIHPIPMVEHLLAMMLAFRWKLRQLFHFQQQSLWPEDRWEKLAMPELCGSTLGIVGYGTVGRDLARLARAMGMRVLALNSSGKRTRDDGYTLPGRGDPDAAIPEKMYSTVNLLDMLPACDYVVMATPLTPYNRHQFNAEAFARMKSTAFFFNVGRGPVVDEAALIEALRQKHIAGAGLDVFEQEPLPADSPLWQMENVIISPHVAGYTSNYDERACALFAENLRRYVAGEPLLNLVERERGY